MSETTGEPSLPAAASAAPPAPTGSDLPPLPREVSVRALLDAGSHFGHQTRRWDPRMRRFIYGERNGIHIINLDQTATRFREAMEFLRDTVAGGGKVLFVGTKRQARGPIKFEAERGEQYYVNNRWLGGMLTNFRTVKKSIELFKEQLELLGDEEKMAELTKKELSRINRSVSKYRKSLDGIREMTRLPSAIFLVDVNKEHIALSEARRLGIPVVAVVDTNCNPEGIDFVIPANDDAIRALQLYCHWAAEACIEGNQLHQERIQSEAVEQAKSAAEAGPSTGRRVVEIKQAPRRGRGAQERGQGPRRGRSGGGGGAAAAAPAEPAPAEAPAPAEPPATPSEGAGEGESGSDA